MEKLISLTENGQTRKMSASEDDESDESDDERYITDISKRKEKRKYINSSGASLVCSYFIVF